MSPAEGQDVFFESLFKRNYNFLKIAACTKIKSKLMAEELVQETFLTAWKKREKLCQHENPDGYLRVVLNYKISEYQRTRNRYLKLFVSLDGDVSSDFKPPSHSILTDTSGIVQTVRNTLTEEDWFLLWRFTIYGDTHRQIAEKLGITVSACQKRLERIRDQLKDVLPDF